MPPSGTTIADVRITSWCRPYSRNFYDTRSNAQAADAARGSHRHPAGGDRGGAAPFAQDSLSLFVRVVDDFGVPVTDLRPEEVIVFEDGMERETVSVVLVEWPVKLTILIDNSARMSSALGQVRSGLRGLIEALPDGVEVALLTTAPQPRFVVRMTADLAEALDGIGRIAPDRGMAAFVDALVETSDRVRDDDSPHFPVVLTVASNGPDPALYGGIDRKVQRLQDQTVEKAATYHAIVWTAPGLAPGRVPGAAQTLVGTRMADLTGGRYEALATTSRLVTLLPELGEQIAASHELQRTQYHVRYARPADAPPPQLDIAADILRSGVRLLVSLDGRLPLP